MTHPDPITLDDARVLAVLAPGESLDLADLARRAELSERRAEHATARMIFRGLLAYKQIHGTGVWEMTARGRGWANTPIGRATLDIPGFAVADRESYEPSDTDERTYR
ncbi:hypothetical protein [Nocardia sp. NPDC058705]|uniref:hypothetical protein n=1 Tax=Nocardia sp. NPDC058705 TaxID=3346609 RepID=UPI00368A963C